MKDTSDRLIYVALGVATVFGVFAFFRVPAYEKGAWAVIGLAVLIVTNVMSFNFGVHQVSPPPGTDQIVHTTTPPAEAAQPDPAPAIPLAKSGIERDANP